MTTRLFAACSPGELRLAVVQEGAIIAAEVHRPASPDRVEEVQLARVGPAAIGASGWFVRLSDTDAFLPTGEVPRGLRPLHEGQAVVVRIVRAAMGGKGLRVSMKRAPSAPAALAAPARIAAAPDPLRRLAALYDAEVVRGAMLPPAIEEQFAALAEPEEALAGGGRLSIHPTPAATLIDIDAGRQPAMDANAEAAEAAARAIRARNLSGVILVDFAALDGAAAKRGMADRLRAALAKDKLEPDVTGCSPAGLIEVVRRKIRPPLHEILGDPGPPFRPSALTLGLSALRQALAEARANPALRPKLRIPPGIAAALEREAGALSAFARQAGAPLVLCIDARLAPGVWSIEDQRDDR